MCLVLFAWDAHPEYQLVMATNRDEFHDRVSTRANFWEELPNVLAGRDLKAGGTWLGVNRQGRFAAITNYRNPRLEKTDAPTRGKLVLDYLKGSPNPLGYLKLLERESNQYNGFNLLVGNREALCYYSNISKKIQRIDPGVYGLSNALLDTGWFKVKRGKKMLEDAIFSAGWSPTDLLDMLYDMEKPSIEELPRTGVSLKLEYELSPMFIKMQGYGTVSSAVTLLDRNGRLTFVERIYNMRTNRTADYAYDFLVP